MCTLIVFLLELFKFSHAICEVKRNIKSVIVLHLKRQSKCNVFKLSLENTYLGLEA